MGWSNCHVNHIGFRYPVMYIADCVYEEKLPNLCLQRNVRSPKTREEIKFFKELSSEASRLNENDFEREGPSENFNYTSVSFTQKGVYPFTFKMLTKFFLQKQIIC